MSAFPDLRSVVRRRDQTPCSLNPRKYKVAGTTELLFDFTTASHKLYLKFHQLHPECKTRKVSSYNRLCTIHQLGVAQHKPFMLERKKKIFVTIIYGYHLQIKLLLLCHSVKLPVSSTFLVIHKIRSILIVTFSTMKIHFDSRGVYLLSRETQRIEATYLFSLFSLKQN